MRNLSVSHSVRNATTTVAPVLLDRCLIYYGVQNFNFHGLSPNLTFLACIPVGFLLGKIRPIVMCACVRVRAGGRVRVRVRVREAVFFGQKPQATAWPVGQNTPHMGRACVLHPVGISVDTRHNHYLVFGIYGR